MGSMAYEMRLSEPDRCDYLYIDEHNRVHLMMPIVSGNSIGRDNTCQLVVELQTFLYGKAAPERAALVKLQHYRKKLKADWNLLDSLGRESEASLKDERLVQIDNYIHTLETVLKDSRLKKEVGEGIYPNLPREARDLMTESNVHSIELSPNTPDNMQKGIEPLFSLLKPTGRFSSRPEGEGWQQQGGRWVSPESLGAQLRSKKLTSSNASAIIIEKALKALKPPFNLQANAKAHDDIDAQADTEIQRLITCLEETYTELTDEPISLGETSYDGSTIDFDTISLINGLDETATAKEFATAILNMAKGVDYWKELNLKKDKLAQETFSTYFKENDGEMFSIKVQFLLAEINLYCHKEGLSFANFGKILDTPPHGNKLSQAIKDAIDEGEPVEEAIFDYLNDNASTFQLSRGLEDSDKEQLKITCLKEFEEIKESQHFDDFLLLRATPNGPFYNHQGRICFNFAEFVNRWQESQKESHMSQALRNSQKSLKLPEDCESLPFKNKLPQKIVLQADSDFIPFSEIPHLSFEQLEAQLHFRADNPERHKAWLVKAFCFLKQDASPLVEAHEALYQDIVTKLCPADQQRLFRYLCELVKTDDYSPEDLPLLLNMLADFGTSEQLFSFISSAKNASQNIITNLYANHPIAASGLLRLIERLSPDRQQNLKELVFFQDYHLEPTALATCFNKTDPISFEALMPYLDKALLALDSQSKFVQCAKRLKSAQLEILNKEKPALARSFIESIDDLMALLPYLSSIQLTALYDDFKPQILAKLKRPNQVLAAAYYFGPKVFKDKGVTLLDDPAPANRTSSEFNLNDAILESLCETTNLREHLEYPDKLSAALSSLSPKQCQKLSKAFALQNGYEHFFNLPAHFTDFIQRLSPKQLEAILPSLFESKTFIRSFIGANGWKPLLIELDNHSKDSLLPIIYASLVRLNLLEPELSTPQAIAKLLANLKKKEPLMKALIQHDRLSRLFASSEDLLVFLQNTHEDDYQTLLPLLSQQIDIQELLPNNKALLNFLAALSSMQRFAFLNAQPEFLPQVLESFNDDERAELNQLLDDQTEAILSFNQRFASPLKSLAIHDKLKVFNEMEHLPASLDKGIQAQRFLAHFLEPHNKVEAVILESLPNIYFNSEEKIRRIVSAALTLKLNNLSFKEAVLDPNSELHQALNVKSAFMGLYLPTFWSKSEKTFDFERARPLIDAQAAATEEPHDARQKKNL